MPTVQFYGKPFERCDELIHVAKLQKGRRLDIETTFLATPHHVKEIQSRYWC